MWKSDEFDITMEVSILFRVWKNIEDFVARILRFILPPKMCTRGQYQMSETKSPHDFTPPSSSNSIEKSEKSSAGFGKYGEYFDPLLPASKEMRDIVGDGISMAGGVAAVLLQIAQPSVGAGVYEHSSFTVRPLERGWPLYSCTLIHSLTYIFRSPLNHIHLCSSFWHSGRAPIHHRRHPSIPPDHQVLNLWCQRCRFTTLGCGNHLLVSRQLMGDSTWKTRARESRKGVQGVFRHGNCPPSSTRKMARESLRVSSILGQHDQGVKGYSGSQEDCEIGHVSSQRFVQNPNLAYLGIFACERANQQSDNDRDVAGKYQGSVWFEEY